MKYYSLQCYNRLHLFAELVFGLTEHLITIRCFSKNYISVETLDFTVVYHTPYMSYGSQCI